MGNRDSLFGHAELSGDNMRNPAVFPLAHQDLVPFHTLPFGDIGQEQNIALINPSNDGGVFGWPLVHAGLILLHLHKEMTRLVELFVPTEANFELEIVREHEKEEEPNRKAKPALQEAQGNMGNGF